MEGKALSQGVLVQGPERTEVRPSSASTTSRVSALTSAALRPLEPPPPLDSDLAPAVRAEPCFLLFGSAWRHGVTTMDYHQSIILTMVPLMTPLPPRLNLEPTRQELYTYQQSQPNATVIQQSLQNSTS